MDWKDSKLSGQDDQWSTRGWGWSEGLEKFVAQHDSDGGRKSTNSNEQNNPACQLDIMKRHGSPSSFIRISQTDLIELESEIHRQKISLSQLAEENKGLILMQDCHIKQI